MDIYVPEEALVNEVVFVLDVVPEDFEMVVDWERGLINNILNGVKMLHDDPGVRQRGGDGFSFRENTSHARAKPFDPANKGSEAGDHAICRRGQLRSGSHGQECSTVFAGCLLS